MTLAAKTSSSRARAVKICARVWTWLRAVTGDGAYESYLRHAATAAEAKPLTAPEFYLDSLRRRYNTISRCC
jgi:uncharacterized short protein YbdD (DUF466 family)